MTAYTPPVAVTLPEPMAPGEFDALRRDAEAATDDAFVKLLAGIADWRLAADRERERLAGQPVQAANGQVGICKGVGTNCDNRVVARVQEWKGGPFTAYAETLTVLTLDGKE